MPRREGLPSGSEDMPSDWPSDIDPTDPSFDIRQEWPAGTKAPGTEDPSKRSREGEGEGEGSQT